MFNTTADAVAISRNTRSAYQCVAQIMLATAMLVGRHQTAVAQAATEQQTTNQQSATESPSRWQFLVNLYPTGDQRDLFARANLTAAQLTYVVKSGLAITTIVGWARGRDRAIVGEPKLDIFTYDIGAELRPARWMAGKTIIFSPFVGLGAGGRSYHYHSLDVAAAHNLSAYISAGGEIVIRRIGVRLELRDYVTGFKPLIGAGSSSARNDVVTMIGLRYLKRIP
jgi:hypothetical protein